MSPSIWNLLQLSIDCFLIILIIFSLIILFRERKQRLALKEWILKQTKVFQTLIDTSDQKAEHLSHSIEDLIDRLRNEIAVAQDALKHLEEVKKETDTSHKEAVKTTMIRPTAEREAIRYLLKKGMKPLEISRQLNLPLGEVELVTKMEAQHRDP